MNNDQLSQLFESAKSIPVETSAEEIASWVGVAAASSTGVLGIAGKLKLFIAKKSIIMFGTSLSIIGAGVITVATLSAADPVKKEAVQPAKSFASAPIETARLDEEPAQELKPVQEIEQDGLPSNLTPRLIERLEGVIPSGQIIPLDHHVTDGPETYQISNRCAPCDSNKQIQASGTVIKKEFAVTDFTELNIQGVFDVVILQGDAAKVVVEADDNLMESFKVKNSGKQLTIDFVGNIKDKKGNTVYITITDLKKLNFSGVGDIRTEGNINLEALECTVSGVGDVKMTMDCADLNVQFSGVGDVILSGVGTTAVYNWSGVGDLEADDLKLKNATLDLSGVGDASLNASENIKVNLSGLGDVKYSGSPLKKDLSTTGMGKIKGS